LRKVRGRPRRLCALKWKNKNERLIRQNIYTDDFGGFCQNMKRVLRYRVHMAWFGAKATISEARTSRGRLR
jgi:hypothetical protein